MGSLINPTCVAREGMRYYLEDPVSCLTPWLVNKPPTVGAVGEGISMTVAQKSGKCCKGGI